jgi:hypothetical protein
MSTQHSDAAPFFGSVDLSRNSDSQQGDLIAWAILGIAIFWSLASWLEKVERQYSRGQLRAAYRKRHSWKKSDLPRLKLLNVNGAARHRMERLTGRGRPVVRLPKPLDEAIVAKINALQALFDADTSTETRRRAFKECPWWHHFVEALYRGEHAIARERGHRGPSIEAETVVGRALGISSASVHSICGEIRGKRRHDERLADFPAMTVAEFESWMQTGIVAGPTDGDCSEPIQSVCPLV